MAESSLISDRDESLMIIICSLFWRKISHHLGQGASDVHHVCQLQHFCLYTACNEPNIALPMDMYCGIDGSYNLLNYAISDVK